MVHTVATFNSIKVREHSQPPRLPLPFAVFLLLTTAVALVTPLGPSVSWTNVHSSRSRAAWSAFPVKNLLGFNGKIGLSFSGGRGAGGCIKDSVRKAEMPPLLPHRRHLAPFWSPWCLVPSSARPRTLLHRPACRGLGCSWPRCLGLVGFVAHEAVAPWQALGQEARGRVSGHISAASAGIPGQVLTAFSLSDAADVAEVLPFRAVL